MSDAPFDEEQPWLIDPSSLEPSSINIHLLLTEDKSKVIGSVLTLTKEGGSIGGRWHNRLINNAPPQYYEEIRERLWQQFNGLPIDGKLIARLLQEIEVFNHEYQLRR